jgi:uncharacterized protein (DUF3820 family)
MLMPFGKHQGKLVATLPKRYLGWLLKNVALRGDLKSAVEAARAGRAVIPVDDLVDELVRTVERRPGA